MTKTAQWKDGSMPNLGGWEFVILIGVLVLLFGAKRLPDMARSIGQSARVFKGEMKGMKGDDTPAGNAAAAPPAGSTATPAPAAELPAAAPVTPVTPAPAAPVTPVPAPGATQEPSRVAGQGPAGTAN
jgi:sec-independent protein translocase protein TatA